MRDPADDDDSEATGRLIRPYAMTRGRTSADVEEISLEAQIQASPYGDGRHDHRWETAAILRIVEQPTALIEVAALADLPIGVVRVLIADLVADGAVVVHRSEPKTSYIGLLEKVLDGVRAL